MARVGLLSYGAGPGLVLCACAGRLTLAAIDSSVTSPAPASASRPKKPPGPMAAPPQQRTPACARGAGRHARLVAVHLIVPGGAMASSRVAVRRPSKQLNQVNF